MRSFVKIKSTKIFKFTVPNFNIHFIFQVTVDASFQYFLRKSDLPLLHKAYDIHYKDVMVSSSIDALKVSTQS